jgi:hypothetical protein
VTAVKERGEGKGVTLTRKPTIITVAWTLPVTTVITALYERKRRKVLNRIWILIIRIFGSAFRKCRS